MSQVAYRYKSASRGFPVDAAVVGERLEEISSKHRGDLTCAAVVEDAAAQDSPLHPCFEWDDRAAAHQHRLRQAGELIRAVVVVVDADGRDREPVRAFVNVQADTRAPGVFRQVESVLRSPDQRELLLDRALREAEAWQKRYDQFSELAVVFQAIAEVRQERAETKPAREFKKPGRLVKGN